MAKNWPTRNEAACQVTIVCCFFFFLILRCWDELKLKLRLYNITYMSLQSWGMCVFSSNHQNAWQYLLFLLTIVSLDNDFGGWLLLELRTWHDYVKMGYTLCSLRYEYSWHKQLFGWLTPCWRRIFKARFRAITWKLHGFI